MGSLGKSPMETLKNFRARKWFDKEFKTFALRVATEFQSRNEVKKGIVVSKQSADADEIKLNVSTGTVNLAGVLMEVGTISNKESIKPFSASLEIAVGGVPTLTANSGTHETLTVSSGGRTCTIRFYDTNASSPTGYDTSGSFSGQIDIDLNGLDAAAVALSMQTILGTVFTTDLGYTISTGSTFTITAPVGSGNDFTYQEEQGLGSLGGTPTNYSSSFGGLITSTGSAQVTALDSSSNAYRITYIVSNSDAIGGATTTDGGTAVIFGILSSSDTTHLTSKQINSAIAGSAGNVGNYDHSGTTGWAHLCQVAFESSDATVTLNRNNAVSKV